MKKIVRNMIAAASIVMTAQVFADNTLTMNFTADQGQGEPAGTVTVTKTKYGLLFTPDLHGLSAGVHGFHVHEKPDCGDNGMAAGGHFDPKKTGKHLGPYDNAGHMGDLPALYVNADGTATTPVLAPRLKDVSAIKQHALMVHHDGDNYTDTPAPNGGGGSRMACTVIE